MFSIYNFKNGIKKFLSELNNYLFSTFEAEKFVTGLFLNYCEQKNSLKLGDMGHSFIYLCRKGKILKLRIKNRNLPLGIQNNIDIQIYSFEPKKDDILIIFTDGLFDQENNKKENYSLSRMSKILQKNQNKDVEVIRDLLLNDFALFRENRHLDDDVTFAIIKFKEQNLIFH